MHRNTDAPEVVGIIEGEFSKDNPAALTLKIFVFL